MTFRSASILWLLAAAPFVLAWLLAREGHRARLARRIVSERLRGIGMPARALRPWLVAAGLVLGVLAAAGPQRGLEVVPVVTRESNRILVIDVSNSMAAEDVGTSRLSAAKALAQRLALAHSGRIGLVAFEATAEIVSPLTSDTDAVAALIDSLQPGELDEPGSDIGTAVIAALTMVDGEPAQRTDVIVISDGEEQGTSIAAAVARAKARGARVSAILIGSGSGSTIPTAKGPMQDESGQTITTYARAESLQAIASQTGGVMLENPFAVHALDPLLARSTRGRERQTHVRVPIDRYQWPLALAFVLLFGASLVNRGAE